MLGQINHNVSTSRFGDSLLYFGSQTDSTSQKTVAVALLIKALYKFDFFEGILQKAKFALLLIY